MTKATTTTATFRLQCSVRCAIQANPARIWGLLTESEVLSGLMLPMIRNSLPEFGPTFEAYAEDLRRAAEGSP